MMTQASTFYDIYEYYYIPFYQQPLFIVLASIVSIGLLGLVGYWLYKRSFKPISPWDWALSEIAKLPTATYTTKDDYKKFYFAITTILKAYLEKRYNWDTQDKTDEELATFLHLHGFQAQLLEKLKKMLQGATWIKFANEEAIRTQVDEDLGTAQLIIKKTIPTKKKEA